MLTVGTPRSVLVVDDELDHLGHLMTFLGNEGFDVAHASDGIDALSYLYARRPRVALIDLMMPRMNGIELIEQMRSDPELAHIVIVAMSGAADMLSRAQLAGANELLHKPLDPGLIVQKLSRYTGPRA